ncbi:MAG: hypothetical protein ABW364_12535 [Rhodococcus fascians]
MLVEDGDEVEPSQLMDRRIFIDSHALRWADLSDGLLEASRLLRRDVDGNPLCGYLSDRSSADFGLEPDEHFSAPQVVAMARSIRAVVVPMFDADRTVAFCRD